MVRVVDGRASSLAIHSVIVAGRRTTVRLEPVMWDALHDIAGRRRVTMNALVTEIDRGRTGPGLTTAIRVYIVEFYRAAAFAAVQPQVPTRPD
jgi:predicted DNA-binding ribbon-helix-helix protein